MPPTSPVLTYIGGPTLAIEWGGLRLLTDPAFDPAGTSYPTAAYTLRKTLGPAVSPNAIGAIDAVLLSHDHHFDNLDHAGRALLPKARRVVTTKAAAARLGDNALGLAAGETTDLEAAGGEVLRVVATPARHGPSHADRGPVVGFRLSWRGTPGDDLWITGDTVAYEGLDDVRALGSVRAVIAFAGAAKVAAVGDWPLTLTAAMTVEIARAFEPATILPAHYEGWEHFSESRADVERAFSAAGLDDRLMWLEPGKPTPLPPAPP